MAQRGTARHGPARHGAAWHSAARRVRERRLRHLGAAVGREETQLEPAQARRQVGQRQLGQLGQPARAGRPGATAALSSGARHACGGAALG
eukprot:245197-Prymnesium_polylepis.1